MKIKEDKVEENIVGTKEEKQRKQFFDFSHSLGVVDKIKTDLTKVMFAFSIVSMILFSLYYPYLIYQNYQSIPHIVAYIILFVCAIVSFSVEMVFKDKKHNSRRDERLADERRTKIAIGTKILKYLAKTVTVIMALLSTIKAPGSNLSIVSAVLSGAMLCVQVLFEVVSACVKRYVEYFEIAFEMDVENSMIFDMYNRKERKVQKLEKELYDIDHTEDYETEQQRKMRAMIVEGAQKHRRNKELSENIQKAKIKTLKQRISAKTKEKKTLEKEQRKEEKIKMKYQKKQQKLSSRNDNNIGEMQELTNQSNVQTSRDACLFLCH